jgi:hypothetical protein
LPGQQCGLEGYSVFFKQHGFRNFAEHGLHTNLTNLP